MGSLVCRSIGEQLVMIIGFIRTSKANNPDGYYVQSRIQTKD